MAYRRAWGISVKRDDDAYLWARWLAPVYSVMVANVKAALQNVDGIGEVTVNMTFDPPWTPDRMSEEAKLELNMF